MHRTPRPHLRPPIHAGQAEHEYPLWLHDEPDPRARAAAAVRIARDAHCLECIAYLASIAEAALDEWPVQVSA